jgi:hypothetical protein
VCPFRMLKVPRPIRTQVLYPEAKNAKPNSEITGQHLGHGLSQYTHVDLSVTACGPAIVYHLCPLFNIPLTAYFQTVLVTQTQHVIMSHGTEFKPSLPAPVSTPTMLTAFSRHAVRP